MLNDRELIEAILGGDEAAFKTLYTMYTNMVYNTALSILQQQTEAEDITQDVFIEIHKSIGKFRHDSSLKTWIYRITITKCYDYLKRQKTKKRFAQLTSLFNSENKLIYDKPHFDHPGVTLENKENASVLFLAIRKLPIKQQTAFTLSKIEHLSYKEIAEIMNTTLSSVESLLFRATRNLRVTLSEYYKNK
jgi:RNA polymerase sigma-70 factor (ECF subfamily)